MARTKYEIIEVNKVEITVDLSLLVKADDMFFNATEISKQFGKRPTDFWKQSQNTDYLTSLVTLSGGSEKDYVRTQNGGKYKGTWLHQKLALQFARWLSSDLAVMLDDWIIKRLKEEEARKKARLAAKTGYLELSEAIQNDHDPVKGYHFSNEANLINNIVLGMSAKKFKEIHGIENIRDNLDAFQIKTIDKLQKMNTSLIELDIEYQDRKDRLTKFYTEKMCLPE